MRVSRKNSLVYFFIALFLSVKMFGYHALSHLDDKDHAIHCAVCDYTITHNLTPLVTPDLEEFAIENTEIIIQKEVSKFYCFTISNAIASNQLFSRPPPFSI